jgi:alginate O-acetyltransferase complex protein AlgI
MLFSSLPFLICFLPFTLLIYYYCPVTKARNGFLLFAGLVFYAWGEPKYLLVMLFSILINYRAGLLLGGVSKRKLVLAIAIIINVLLLIYFKYFIFSARIINAVFAQIIGLPQIQIPMPEISLPLGISFYTFQSISYLVDVYRKPQLVQKNILNMGLYISFFPQLIAGPIVRYHDINEQIINRPHSITLFAQGAERFIIGLAKKLLIANQMAVLADDILIFPPDSAPYYMLILGIVCYTLQIYYDFSGYSDMAIGLGQMFGFNILNNFNYPYTAKSITEFWRRWHISLSAWFKDYLYIPLGGNRKGKIRTAINLFIVFITTGIWHGAAFHFVFWGMAHGLLLFIEKLVGKKIASLIKSKSLRSILGHLYTLVSLLVLWVFFTLGIRDSFRFLSAIFSLNPGNKNFRLFIQSKIDTQFFVCLIAAVLFAFPWWRKIPLLYKRGLIIPRYIALLILLVLSICQLASGAYNPFIYFRF